MNIGLIFTTNFILISGAIILVIVASVTLIMLRKKPEVKKTELEPLFLDDLLTALGGKTNIINVQREHQRIQLEVKSVKQVQADLLTKINMPAFVKGNKLTLFVKNHTDEVISFLTEHRKEDN